MRYENLIESNLAMFDLPSTKINRTKTTYFEEIFKRLLVYDQQPDNDFIKVLNEATEVPGDPAFAITFHNSFEKFIQNDFPQGRWQKITQDYNYFIKSETKRRNKNNPYHTETLTEQSFQKLPDFLKMKPGESWQFQSLYKELRDFAAKALELSKDYEQKQDKDLFRLRVNGILSADKLIFAQSNIENYKYHLEKETNLINIKLSLDGFKLAYTYLNRCIESLHKMHWSAESEKEQLNKAIHTADSIADMLKAKIFETEKLFTLFLSTDFPS